MKFYQKSLVIIVGCLLLCLGAFLSVYGDSQPIILVDHLGRTIELPGPAQRVIGTHNPSNNMTIVLDGNASRFVGFGNKDMAFGLYEIVAPTIEEMVQIGRGQSLNLETIVAVNPDLMILPVRFSGLINQIEELGIPTLALHVEKFESISAALLLVGKAIGQDERAEEIVAFIEEKMDKFSGLADTIDNKPRVMMTSKSSETRVSTDEMLQNQMIELAGGISVTAGFQPADFWAEVDMEQIIEWNPEVIFVPTYADYSIEEDLYNNPRWANISAVQNRRIFNFPSIMDPWDYPTAASVLGLCWAFNNLYPELYSFEELMQDVDDFYQFVYGISFTAEELGIAQ